MENVNPAGVTGVGYLFEISSGVVPFKSPTEAMALKPTVATVETKANVDRIRSAGADVSVILNYSNNLARPNSRQIHDFV